MEDNPFPDLKIDDFAFLNGLEARQRCGVCQKSRMFYCYTCFIALPSLADKLPTIKLPFKVNVLKHPGEKCGKSTAVHAAVLASDDVTIYTYPDIPEYKDDVRAVLVYPGGNAVTMKDFMRSDDDNQTEKDGVKDITFTTVDVPTSSSRIIDVVVFIDSTWFQVLKIASDPRIANLQRIELTTHETKFWRYQLDKPSTYLSTIEAIYYCCCEYDECRSGSEVAYNGRYDNLLFFFGFFYQKIKMLASKTGKKLKAYHHERRKKPKTN